MMWKISFRADQTARKIADRHYNRQSVGSKQFVPPGRCLVLISTDEKAFWVTSFPFAEYTKHEWAGAWICSAFRNESKELLSSDLIREAVAISKFYFGTPPDLGMVTFVNPDKIKSENPGYCFKKAGFKTVGKTKVNKLIALQLLPGDMPKPQMAINQQNTLF